MTRPLLLPYGLRAPIPSGNPAEDTSTQLIRKEPYPLDGVTSVRSLRASEAYRTDPGAFPLIVTKGEASGSAFR